jgi:hypothetical protein
MVRRKGELYRAGIDRDWPHQVALPAEAIQGLHYADVQAFCKLLTLCPRGYSFVRDGQRFNVFCFADPDHAVGFRDRFDGEAIDCLKRPRWLGR